MLAAPNAYFKPVISCTNYAKMILAHTPSGYWRLGESSGNFQDFSTNSNVATELGAIVRNVGALINDSNNSIEVSGAGWAEINGAAEVGNLAAFSIEAWIKPIAINAGIVYSENAAGGYETGISLRSGGTVAFDIWHGVWSQAISTTSMTIGVTYHVVGTMDPVNGMIIYVNGVADGSNANTTLRTGGIVDIRIGIDGNETDSYDGGVDEVAVYDYALTPAQILAHYECGRPVFTYQEKVLADNPYIYFPFDEASGTSPAQIGSSPATGTHVNAVSGVTALHNGSDYAVRYNGIDAQTFFLVDGSLSSDSVWTVEFFAKVTESGRSGQGVAIWHSGNNQPTNQGGYEVMLTPAGEILVSGYASTAWRSVTTTGFGFNDNTTYSVTVTCDTTAQKMRFYKNGVFHEELAWIWGVAQTTGTYNWRIGVQSQDSPVAWFPGDIDSVSYYDGRILSDARITAHYNASK